MTVLLTVALAVLFFVMVMASIALHEIGHLVPAKLFGVKVSEYFVGFGKTLWSIRRGETEYGIKAIPLGGYVRLLGMYPPEKPGKKGWLTRMADDARAAEYQDISPADDGRLLHQKKPWQKIIVMLGGPAMNLLLAFLIFLGINVFHGTYQPTHVVAGVAECVIPADREPAVCQADDPPSPAKQAGIHVGDQITYLNGVRSFEWDAYSQLIRDNGDGPLVVEVLRDGQQIRLPEVHTVINQRPDRWDPTKLVDVGFFGVTPEQELRKGGPLETMGQMADMTRMSLTALATFPVRVWNVGVGMVTGQARDVNSPLSILGASRAAGEVATAEQLEVSERVVAWLSLLGSVNLFVALLNLVPLPPLDGGHVAGAVYEWLRRGVAKVLRRPDPGYADTAKLLPIAYLVGGFLLLGGVVLIIADIVSPIQLL